jgi:TolA-binding protein
LYRDVDSTLQQQFTPDEQREQLKTTMQSLRGEFFGEQVGDAGNASVNTPVVKAPAKVVSFNRYLKAAVAIAAVLVIGLFVWQPWQTDLYTKYADAKMIRQEERGGYFDTVMTQATTAFNNREFTTAAVLLSEIVQKEPENSFASFYFGVALLQSGKNEAARNVFARLSKGESAFKYEAVFYTALSYLKEKEKEAAKAWLEKIPADAANYGKAQELLKKL